MEGNKEINVIHNTDCLSGMKILQDNSIDCCITSPPYFGLRDYGTDEQIGLEPTPEEFVNSLVDVFTEVKRVLKPEGTLWINIGDSYAAAAKNRSAEQATAKSTLGGGKNTQLQVLKQQSKITGSLKQKDLIGVPWMMAFALRSAGWYLRQDIIWNKPNPMPESVTDRCTKAHEYIFLLSKSQRYYYDAESIRVPLADESIARLAQDIESQKGSSRVPGKKNGLMKAVGRLPADGGKKYGNSDDEKNRTKSGKQFEAKMSGSGKINHCGRSRYFDKEGNLLVRPTANKKSVWTVTTKPFKEAHFATFPEDLIVDCIKAGCPEDGIVLDPFMGAGTTALVARKLNRNFIGFELNPEYIKIAEKRISAALGLFK